MKREKREKIKGFKWCSKCQHYQEISEFHKNRTTSDGLADWCKICTAKNSKVKGYSTKYNKKQTDNGTNWFQKKSVERVEKLGRIVHNWTLAEDEYIKSQYNNISAAEIGSVLNRTEGAVRQRIFRLVIAKQKSSKPTAKVYTHPELTITKNWSDKFEPESVQFSKSISLELSKGIARLTDKIDELIEIIKK